MRAAFITGSRALEFRELELPVPRPGEVRIRVDHVGICGSDLHYFLYGENSGFVVREALIPGHELAGTVDLDPAGTWLPGQAVTVHPARYGEPQPRWPEHPHLWPGGSYLGSASTWPHTQGAMAEQMVVDSSMLRALPDGLSTRSAVLAEPLAVALHGLAVAQRLQGSSSPEGGVQGAHVLVTGAGPIGLLAAAAAQAHGAASVTVTDVLSGPLERARAAGADQVLDTSAQSLQENAWDLALECSGAAPAAAAAVAAVRPAGAIVQLGMVSAGFSGPSAASLITKEVALCGSFRFHTELEEAVELLVAQPQLSSVITHDFGLHEALQAFTTAADPQVSGKVLISPQVA